MGVEGRDQEAKRLLPRWQDVGRAVLSAGEEGKMEKDRGRPSIKGKGVHLGAHFIQPR